MSLVKVNIVKFLLAAGLLTYVVVVAFVHFQMQLIVKIVKSIVTILALFRLLALVQLLMLLKLVVAFADVTAALLETYELHVFLVLTANMFLQLRF